MKTTSVMIGPLIGLTLVSCDATPTMQAAAQTAPPPVIEEVKFLPCPEPDVGRACEADQTFTKRDWPKALAGDYQAQRNVSYMFTAGRPWVVERPVQGCAWRMVIMATRPAGSTMADAGMYRIQCGRLSERDLAEAKRVANAIHRQIHGSDLPELPPAA